MSQPTARMLRMLSVRLQNTPRAGATTPPGAASARVWEGRLDAGSTRGVVAANSGHRARCGVDCVNAARRAMIERGQSFPDQARKREAHPHAQGAFGQGDGA